MHLSIRLLACLWSLSLLALTHSGALLALLLVVLAGLALRCPDLARRWRRSLRYGRWLLLSIALFHLAFTPGVVLWRWGPLVLTDAGMKGAVFFSSLLVFATGAVAWLWTRGSAADVLAAISWLVRPLNRLGIRTATLTERLVAVLALLQGGLPSPRLSDLGASARGAPVELAADMVVAAIVRCSEQTVPSPPGVVYTLAPPAWRDWSALIVLMAVTTMVTQVPT